MGSDPEAADLLPPFFDFDLELPVPSLNSILGTGSLARSIVMTAVSRVVKTSSDGTGALRATIFRKEWTEDLL